MNLWSLKKERKKSSPLRLGFSLSLSHFLSLLLLGLLQSISKKTAIIISFFVLFSPLTFILDDRNKNGWTK